MKKTPFYKVPWVQWVIGTTVAIIAVIVPIIALLYPNGGNVSQSQINSPNAIQANGPVSIKQIDKQNLTYQIKRLSVKSGKIADQIDYQILFSEKPLGAVGIQISSVNYNLSEFINPNLSNCSSTETSFSTDNKIIKLKYCKSSSFVITPVGNEANFSIWAKNENDVNISVYY